MIEFELDRSDRWTSEAPGRRLLENGRSEADSSITGTKYLYIFVEILWCTTRLIMVAVESCMMDLFSRQCPCKDVPLDKSIIHSISSLPDPPVLPKNKYVRYVVGQCCDWSRHICSEIIALVARSARC